MIQQGKNNQTKEGWLFIHLKKPQHRYDILFALAVKWARSCYYVSTNDTKHLRWFPSLQLYTEVRQEVLRWKLPPSEGITVEYNQELNFWQKSNISLNSVSVIPQIKRLYCIETMLSLPKWGFSSILYQPLNQTAYNVAMEKQHPLTFSEK